MFLKKANLREFCSWMYNSNTFNEAPKLVHIYSWRLDLQHSVLTAFKTDFTSLSNRPI